MNVINLLKPKATVAYLYNDCTARQALEKLRAHGFASIPVISKEGTYIGSVTEGDFLWYILEHGTEDIKYLEDKPLNDLLRQEFNPPVKIDVKVDELVLRSLNQNFIPVVDDRNLFIGIITRQDIIRHFSEKVQSITV